MKKWLVFIPVAVVCFLWVNSKPVSTIDFMHNVSVWLNEKEIGRAIIEGSPDSDRFDAVVNYDEHKNDTLRVSPSWCGGGPDKLKIEMVCDSVKMYFPNRWGGQFLNRSEVYSIMPMSITVIENWAGTSLKAKKLDFNLYYFDQERYGKDTVKDPVGSIYFE